MSTDHLDHDRQRILSAKQERLRQRRAKTPPVAVVALAEMQDRPRPVLNVVTGGGQVLLIGQITYTETYDPVGTALRYARIGVEAISFYTDAQLYTQGLEDLLMLSRGVKLPVIYQNFVLDEYHVAEARAAGASALTLFASVLDERTLGQTVSITQRWRMAAIMQIAQAQQIAMAERFSPHVVAVGDPFNLDVSHALDLLAEVRPQVPRYSRVMIHHPLPDLDHARAALALNVDALVLDHRLLDDAEAMLELLSVSKR